MNGIQSTTDHFKLDGRETLGEDPPVQDIGGGQLFLQPGDDLLTEQRHVQEVRG